MKLKINFKSVLKYSTIFFLFLIFSVANINGLNPFVFTFFFACLYVGLEEKLISIFLIGSELIFNPNLENLFVCVTVVFVGLLILYLHKIFKQRYRLITLFLTMLLSFCTYYYYNFKNLINIVYFCLLAMISLYSFIVVLHIVFLRKNCFKLTLDESICFLFTIAVLGLGFAPIKIFGVEFYKFILMILIYIFISVGSPGLTYAVTLSLSFGVAVYNFSLIPIAEFAIVALVSGIFRMPNKFKIIFTSLLTSIFINFYFISNLVLWQAILPIVLASVVYILIPKKQLNLLADKIYVNKSELSSRNVINVTRKNLRKRMSELSNVFMEMKQIHLGMIKKQLTKEELNSMFLKEISCTCCKDCLEKSRCYRSLGTNNKSNIEVIVEKSLIKGKIGLLDVPSSLVSRCEKTNLLINFINRMNDEYKQYKTMVSDVNNVKVLLADQMGAVSNLLLSLGQEIDTNVSFDIARENKIISRLLNNNIECKEVLLYTEKNSETSAVCVVQTNPKNNAIIEKVISETLKLQMQITDVKPLEEGDYSAVTLRKKSKFDCVFGLAACSKSGNQESGDCHSIIRLGSNKFLLALCDGMGSGKQANKISALTISLIEDFYKAGFDNDIILESVNKLLAVNNQETYSTLDVCLLDLENQLADFIKVGAPFGVVKKDGKVEVVEGGALPIGTLDNISPKIFRTTISTKDIVILATDGVMDAFSSEEKFIDYVSGLVSNNPQTLAENILNEALRLNNMSAKDDCTVLVARTYLKS